MEEFKPRDYIEMETETNMDRADGLADELEGLTAAVKQCKDLDFLLPRFEKALDAANTLQGIMDDLYMDVCDAVMKAEEDDRTLQSIMDDLYKGVRTMDKKRQQMVQLMGKTVGHVFEELDIVYRQHPEVQNDKHFHTALALLQGIQCMTWELENEEKPPAGETTDGQTGKDMSEDYPSLF